MSAREPVIRIAGLEKQFGGLRPLRIANLSLRADQRVAITGIDGPGAEVLVNLVTGATLPDAGNITVFGQATSAIVNADDWLATLDRFGLVSSRAVLVDDLSLGANIATAFTLSIDPIPDRVLDDVRRLAAEVDLPADRFDARVGDLDAAFRARCHLARALASGPRVLVLEHANVLAADHALAFGRVIARVARSRRLPLLALTADQGFARVVAGRVLRLDPATGQLLADSRWRRWLSASTRQYRCVF
ncbi:MAG: ATP-binding cassette domain-containing protein [Acidobacteria bacterium]|nr:ATP-binding cassette domain-containing protein [Acidobacteriota bacterium]